MENATRFLGTRLLGAIGLGLGLWLLASCVPGAPVPTLDTAEVQADGTTIRVGWDDVGVDIHSYEVWYRPTGTTEWVWSSVASVGADHGSWVPIVAGAQRYERDFRATGITADNSYDIAVRTVPLAAQCPCSSLEHPSASATVDTGNGGWTMTFNDEFDGNTLDTNKWDVIDHGIGNYYSCMRAENVVVGGGTVDLMTRSEPATCNGGQTLPYTGSYIQTKNSPANFSQAYGKFEFRAKMPTGIGLWPAIWLTNVNTAAQGELDVIESIGVDTTWWASTLHWYPSGSFTGEHKVQSSHHPTNGGIDLADGFHTYTLTWTPCRITIDVDGQVQADWSSWFDAMPEPFDADGPLHIRLDNKIGRRDKATGELRSAIRSDNLADPANPLPPTSMELQWVRVYEKPNYALPAGCPRL